jgi:hypothetical protein
MHDRLQQYAIDPAAFFADLIIPSSTGPTRFADCWAPFQVEWFQAVAPSLLAVAKGESPPIGRFWVERTKGASKDSDLALCLIWLLAFTKRPLDCQVAAADQDQGDEVRKAARDVLRLNPWVAERVRVQNWKIICDATESACDIVAADVGGSHGSRPDVLFVNELSHVHDGKQDFVLTLLDNASKKPQGLVLVATNAGFAGSWQIKLREMAQDSDRWHFHVFDRPAPWVSQAEIDEAKRRSSSSRYFRLWWGRWCAGTGDALDPEDIAACTDPNARPMNGDERGFGFVAGLDLGLTSDRSALCALGIDGASQRSRLAACEAWSAGPNGQVDLEQVRFGVLQLHWQLRGNLVVGYDPWQCEYMALTLRREGVNMVAVPFSGKNLDTMASAVLMAFRSRTITLYPDPHLLADLSRLSIVEKSYGYRLQATKDKSGHADRATAFAIAASGIMPTIGDYSEPIHDEVVGHIGLDGSFNIF